MGVETSSLTGREHDAWLDAMRTPTRQCVGGMRQTDSGGTSYCALGLLAHVLEGSRALSWRDACRVALEVALPLGLASRIEAWNDHDLLPLPLIASRVARAMERPSHEDLP